MRPALGDDLMPLQTQRQQANAATAASSASSFPFPNKPNARHLTWLGRLAMPIPSEKGAAIVHRRDDRQGVEGGEERGGRRRRRGDRERDNDGRTGWTNSSRDDPWRCLLLFVACGRNAGASIPCLPSLPLLWPQLVSHSKEIWLITFAILIPACVNAVPTRYMVS